MTIKDLTPGQKALILTVGGEGALRQHFLDMGLIPGTEVQVIKYAPMGDPIEVKIYEYELTLRLADAEKITVSQIDNVEETPEIQKLKTPVTTKSHPGIGEGGKYHVKSRRKPYSCRRNNNLCSCRQSELRKNNTFQPAYRCKPACG